MWFLFACTQADFDAALLTPDPLAEVLPELTEVRVYGEARLTHDAVETSIAEDGLRWTSDYAVVDWTPERVRVVAREDDQLRLLLWLERQDLVTRTYEPGLGTAGDGELEIPGGYPINPIERNEHETLVQVEGNLLIAEVWIPSALVDQVWVPEEATPLVEWVVEPIYLPDRVEFLEEPGGEVFAWMEPVFNDDSVYVDYIHEALLLDQTDDGYALVRVQEDGLAVTGWVEDWNDFPNGGFGYGCGFGSHCGCWMTTEEAWASGPIPDLNVPAHTPLEAPDGTVVGMTLTDQTMDLGETDTWGRHSVEVWTDWGDLEVWLSVP